MARNTFDIEKFSNEIMQNCDTCQVKEFAKNEIITTYIVNRNMLCVLLEGSADLIRYDFDGNQMIVEKFNKYDVFGEIFYRININNELFVKAREKTKISDLNLRIELLSKKTIRDKILSYFRVLSENNFSKTFTLPFSLTDLADYLSIDRSAMMREIKILKEDGIIKKQDKNRFTLLNQ